MTINQKYFNKYLSQNYIFEKKPKIAIAVSGGPDSMCLLFLLKNWIDQKNGTLIAIIIDHQLRKESYYEANYISSYLDLKKINSKIIKVNSKKIDKKTMQESRNNRYTKLINFCKKKKILHLFIGHHQDDNIETYLIRKIAGSNFEGLRCMQNKIVLDDLQVLRPLLEIDKKEIFSFNKYKKINFVQDPTNNNLNFTRTIIRQFLFNEPFLKKIIKKDFKVIKDNYSFYKKMIFQSLNELIININNRSITIDARIFLITDIIIQTKIIEILFKYLRPKKTTPRYNKIINSLKKLENSKKIELNLAGILIKKDQPFIKVSI